MGERHPEYERDELDYVAVSWLFDELQKNVTISHIKEKKPLIPVIYARGDRQMVLA